MTKPSLVRYRTKNWSDHNTTPRERSSLPIWLDREMTWLAPHDGRLGHPSVFSNAAIRFRLSITMLFKLPLRQTAGMAAGLRPMAELNWPVPDYSTLCRRQKILAV